MGTRKLLYQSGFLASRVWPLSDSSHPFHGHPTSLRRSYALIIHYVLHNKAEVRVGLYLSPLVSFVGF